MQPSGEIGRFEMVDLPSPPADRRRYPTEIHAALSFLMTLTDLLDRLATFDDDQTVYVDAAAPLSPTIDACVSDPPDELDALPDGKRELMDVWHARDVLAGCRKLLDDSGDSTSHEDCVRRFLRYLDTDA
jgi:hypothetical protein